MGLINQSNLFKEILRLEKFVCKCQCNRSSFFKELRIFCCFSLQERIFCLTISLHNWLGIFGSSKVLISGNKESCFIRWFHQFRCTWQSGGIIPSDSTKTHLLHRIKDRIKSLTSGKKTKKKNRSTKLYKNYFELQKIVFHFILIIYCQNKIQTCKKGL